jgi:hypothetical protein
MDELTETTRIALAPRFRFDTAEDSLEAVQGARIKCLTAGQELIGAHYDLTKRNGVEPTAIQLIEATRQRYTPPRSHKESRKFWWDYIRTNIRRGIFQPPTGAPRSEAVTAEPTAPRQVQGGTRPSYQLPSDLSEPLSRLHPCPHLQECERDWQEAGRRKFPGQTVEPLWQKENGLVPCGFSGATDGTANVEAVFVIAEPSVAKGQPLSHVPDQALLEELRFGVGFTDRRQF